MNRMDVHADDYGLTLNVSRQILVGVNAGKLTGISIVPNMSAFDDCVNLWKSSRKEGREPFLSVHLNFMEGHCCSDKSRLTYLVDSEGFFNISWGTLVKYHYNPKVRGQVKIQLKREIEAQLEKVIRAYNLLEEKKLRVDSHQHTHMIPLVMEALLEVMKEKKYPAEYIRISREPWQTYLKYPALYPSYRIINLIKVLVLNYFAGRDEKMISAAGIPPMLLCGVFFSGKMDYDRVSKLLPLWKKAADRKEVMLEILLHPGETLAEELSEEFNHPEANKFYLSANRRCEYDTMMKLEGNYEGTE